MHFPFQSPRHHILVRRIIVNMITYSSSGGVFGLAMLFRLHGSAVFKSCTPAVLSSILYVLLFRYTHATENDFLDNPYPMGALVTAFSFLLIFRANFAYNRYWEANTSIHVMHSKWLDAATEITASHLQSKCYAAIQPPSFGQQQQRQEQELQAKSTKRILVAMESSSWLLGNNKKQRQQNNPMTQEELGNEIDGRIQMEDSLLQPSLRARFAQSKGGFSRFLGTNPRRRQQHGLAPPTPRRDGSEGGMPQPNNKGNKPSTILLSSSSSKPSNHYHHHSSRSRESTDFYDPVHADAKGATPRSTFWSHVQARLLEGHMGDVPVPLFLEAIAHLLSLMSAVALSTLRNDLEEAESPLAEFRPSAPWPFVDPDRYTRKIRSRWDQSEHRSYTLFRYLLGLSRTDASRRLYNIGRPFRVIGSVSDEEIKALQAARGPQAKVTLISLWLQELITREHLAGLTGAVAPPIIARIYQLISDGMAGYNQARKVAYIPFPFPHAQLTTLFVLVIIGFIPLLMLTYVDDVYFGFVWNWLTVMCFTGLHEVARELENPFQNVPNEIPLNNFQAQFNEGLMVMFYGYHPDAYWLTDDLEEEDGEGNDRKKNPIDHGSRRPDQGATTPKTSNHTTLEEKKTGEDSQIAGTDSDPSPSPPKRFSSKEGPHITMSTWDDRMLVAVPSMSHDESIDSVSMIGATDVDTA